MLTAGSPLAPARPAGYISVESEEAAMSELVFVVEEAPEGGYVARAVGASIVTEADDLEGLREEVRDAVRCHFDEETVPKLIRLH
jgi:hypothetical protein